MKRNYNLRHTLKRDWDEGVGKSINTELVPGDVILNMVKNMTKGWRKLKTEKHDAEETVIPPRTVTPEWGGTDGWHTRSADDLCYHCMYETTYWKWNFEGKFRKRLYLLEYFPASYTGYTRNVFRSVWYFGMKPLKFLRNEFDQNTFQRVVLPEAEEDYSIAQQSLRFGWVGDLGEGLCYFHTYWPYKEGLTGEDFSAKRITEVGCGEEVYGTFTETAPKREEVLDFYRIEVIGTKDYDKQVKLNIKKYTICTGSKMSIFEGWKGKDVKKCN